VSSLGRVLMQVPRMTVLFLGFIFSFVIAKSCSESLGIHPKPRVRFCAQFAFIDVSHAEELWSMRKHGYRSCLFPSEFIQPSGYCIVF